MRIPCGSSRGRLSARRGLSRARRRSTEQVTRGYANEQANGGHDVDVARLPTLPAFGFVVVCHSVALDEPEAVLQLRTIFAERHARGQVCPLTIGQYFQMLTKGNSGKKTGVRGPAASFLAVFWEFFRRISGKGRGCSIARGPSAGFEGRDGGVCATRSARGAGVCAGGRGRTRGTTG